MEKRIQLNEMASQFENAHGKFTFCLLTNANASKIIKANFIRRNGKIQERGPVWTSAPAGSLLFIESNKFGDSVKKITADGSCKKLSRAKAAACWLELKKNFKTVIVKAILENINNSIADEAKRNLFEQAKKIGLPVNWHQFKVSPSKGIHLNPISISKAKFDPEKINLTEFRLFKLNEDSAKEIKEPVFQKGDFIAIMQENAYTNMKTAERYGYHISTYEF